MTAGGPSLEHGGSGSWRTRIPKEDSIMSIDAGISLKVEEFLKTWGLSPDGALVTGPTRLLQ